MRIAAVVAAFVLVFAAGLVGVVTPAAGQTVFHLHFHILPRFDGVPPKPHSGVMEDQAVLAANAEKLRQALAS